MPDRSGHFHRHRFPTEISECAEYRTLLQERFQSWREVAEVCPAAA